MPDEEDLEDIANQSSLHVNERKDGRGGKIGALGKYNKKLTRIGRIFARAKNPKRKRPITLPK